MDRLADRARRQKMAASNIRIKLSAGAAPSAIVTTEMCAP